MRKKTNNSRLPRVAVVGCGYWGNNLVRNFSELGALSGVCDSDLGRVADCAERYEVPALTFDEALSTPEIDGLVIATPAETHAELGIRALEAGKHVLIEKPLALLVSDAERIIEKAEKTGLTLMVGHLLQYHPAFVKLKESVSEGRLGRIRYIYSNRLNLGRIRREENVFWSFAPHDLSMILALAGELPDGVQAIGACYLHKVIADVTTTHLSFPSGINAHVFVSWLHPFKEQKLIVVGEDAMAVFDDRLPWPEKLVLYHHRIEWRDGLPEPNTADAEPVPLERAEPLKLECQHFLDCIANGAHPRTDGAEGLCVLKVLDAAERAIRAGSAGSIVSLNYSSPAAAMTRDTPETPSGVFVHESAYLDEGSQVGAGTRIWHFSHVLKGSRIGRNCTIGQNVMIGPDVTLGDNCKIQNNVSLYKGVTMDDGVFCGPSCVFTNVNTPRAEIERKDEFSPTRVGRGATIGANATIVCGVTLGEYCFIAAGAVVTKDVPPYGLAAGVPARLVGWACECGVPLKSVENQAVCARCGTRYEKIGEAQVRRVA